MAIDSVSDCLLGVSINVEAKNQDENKTLEESIEEYNHPKFKHILTVLHRYVSYHYLSGNLECNLFMYLC